jgi:hypothetical protein
MIKKRSRIKNLVYAIAKYFLAEDFWRNEDNRGMKQSLREIIE